MATQTKASKRPSERGPQPSAKRSKHSGETEREHGADLPNLQEIVSKAVAEALPSAVSQAVKAAVPAIVSTMPLASGNAVGSNEAGATALIAAADITGGEVENKIQSVALPPDLHVSESLKSKITGDKYVNFGKLLYKDQDESKFTLKLNSSTMNSKSPSFVVDTNENSVKIRYIEVWDKAFTIFQYRYVIAHPEQVQGLIMHGRLIKDMAWRGFGWLQYDEQFRRLRETDPAAYPWGVIEPNLWATWALPRGIGQFSIDNTIGRGQYRASQGFVNDYSENESSDSESDNHYDEMMPDPENSLNYESFRRSTLWTWG